MIAGLRGTVLALVGGSCVVDVNGVGYAVQITPDHAMRMRVGETTSVVTSLIVREDSMTLFGFETKETLEVFTALVGVTGVGPKSALAVLSELTAGEVAAAVAVEDDATFRRVSGIGPKTAKLIVVSLSGKLFAPVSSTTSTARPTFVGSVRDDVLAALVGLGWPERGASEAIDRALQAGEGDDLSTVPMLLRRALGELGPGKTATNSR